MQPDAGRHGLLPRDEKEGERVERKRGDGGGRDKEGVQNVMYRYICLSLRSRESRVSCICSSPTRMYMCVCVHIRELAEEMYACVYIYVCKCVCIYIYIYIYSHALVGSTAVSVLFVASGQAVG